MIAKTVAFFACAALLETASAFNANREDSKLETRQAVNVFGSKRGQAYNDASLANTFRGDCSSCSWAYNWGQTSDGLESGVSFVPMLHDSSQVGSWVSNANAAISAGSKALLSFNEPDISTQANLSPSSAASLHIQYMNQFSGRARIGAPAVSNSGSSGQGLDWLSQWISACNGGCDFDFCPIHWYSGYEYETTLFDQLASAYSVCGGKPIWLTEFAPTDGTDDTTNSFISYAIPKLESLSYLEAYSYFMTEEGSLFSSGNSLSSYGSNYATQPSTPA